MNKLYVIVVTYNGEKWIERCLSSVYKSTIEAIPIVLDNGSTDKTISIIQTKFPNVNLIVTGENLGFGRANNLGVKMAIEEGADYVYLLNQDAWVDPNVFEKLMNLMKEHSDYGILSPIQITADRLSVDRGFFNNTVKGTTSDILYNDLLLDRPKQIYDVLSVMAAHWMVSVNALQKVGLFSRAFPHYGEDSNLTRRMHYHGYKVGIVPRVYAVHDREFRYTPPNKKVYLHYIRVLSSFHNIYKETTMSRMNTLIRLLVKILFTRGASFSMKAEFFRKSITLILEAKKFRKLYIQGYGMD